MFKMNIVYLTLNLLVLLLCIIFGIYSYRRYRRMLSEIDELKFEISKLNFRLFVAEKKQKINNKDNISNSVFSS
jgi:hypothetical protein